MSEANDFYLGRVTAPSSGQIEIETNAVITVSRQVQVASSPEAIWGLLINFAKWPDWNSKVTKIKVYGENCPGTVIRWKIDHVKIKSVLQSVVPCKKLSWSGKAIGIKAIHTYQLKEANYATLVESTVHWSGILPKLLTRHMKKRLEESVSYGLESLCRASAEIV
ncbi:MAG: SRPBCC family protein [Firmicutes bacterium]|jgi:hypothetical protein|nr:SRPBCC family protein [Bacillota bacterium]